MVSQESGPRADTAPADSCAAPVAWLPGLARRVGLGGAIVLPLALAVSILSWNAPTEDRQVPVAGADAASTAQYLRRLDVRAFERKGTDFAHQAFSPARLGIPVHQLDIMTDYEFERVAELRRALKGVDRPAVLRHIFATVTEGARTNAEKHRAILTFVQKSSFHNAKLQPLEPEKRSVMDPLIVLELGEMHCGNASRLAVDLFEAAGIKGRLVQLGGHVIAELHYDGGWHYFDADIFGNGETVVKEDGTIPSITELGREPYRIDALAHYQELQFPAVANSGSAPYPSWHFFGKGSYGGRAGEPVYYEKTADALQVANKYYGWNHVRTIPDPQRRLEDFPPFYQPGAVTFTRIEVGREGRARGTVRLAWTDAQDRDGDLLGYRVFVSRQSRGWAYGKPSLPGRLGRFAGPGSGWRPEMYDRLFELPPHEVARLQTGDPSASLSLERGSQYFITVMPYDRHGEAVGKTVYQMSDELQVTL